MILECYCKNYINILRSPLLMMCMNIKTIIMCSVSTVMANELAQQVKIRLSQFSQLLVSKV